MNFWPQIVRPADVEVVGPSPAVLLRIAVGQRRIAPTTDFERWQAQIVKVDCRINIARGTAGFPVRVVHLALFAGEVPSPCNQQLLAGKRTQGAAYSAHGLPDEGEGIKQIELQEMLEQ